MAQSEPRLSLSGSVKAAPPSTGQLLALATRLAEPHLGLEARLDLVEQLRCVLDGKTLECD
jgi:hypothetical protein